MRCCNTFFDAFVTEITFVDTCVTETMTFCQMGGCELSLGRVRTAGIYCTAFADISLIWAQNLSIFKKNSVSKMLYDQTGVLQSHESWSVGELELVCVL